MTPTITPDVEQRIIDTLATMPTLANGVGTAERACSIAAINLALSGELTDKIPDCMSRAIGRWIIAVQDCAPAEQCRDHPEWRRLLPLAAGTGREHEAERLAMVMDWMWQALALVQPEADAGGYGEAWRRMLTERTASYARRAADAAFYASKAAFYAAADAFYAANADADAAFYDAYDAADAALKAAGLTSWEAVDPVALLRRLIAVTDARANETRGGER